MSAQRGGPGNPFTVDDHRDKFRANVVPSLGVERTEQCCRHRGRLDGAIRWRSRPPHRARLSDTPAMDQQHAALDGQHAGDAAPLHGIRVVGLEHAVAAPLRTRHLGDLGAEVIKVERPETGDFARGYYFVVDGQSTYHAWLSRGKRSVVLDLKSAAGHASLEALLATADVFVHNLGPGAVERMGFGWEALHARWPRLVSCAISGYGTEGPLRERKSFDLLLQGEAAIFAVTGSPAAPAKVGLPVGDISAAMYALSAILAALNRRQATGRAAASTWP